MKAKAVSTKDLGRQHQPAAHRPVDTAGATFQFQDRRATALQQAQLQGMVDSSKTVQRLMDFQSRVAHLQAHPVVQLKNEEERARAQQKAAHARNTIAAVAPNFNANIAGHIFEGKPAAGGNADPDNPEGLHGYTGGALPAGVVTVARVGNQNKKHTLTWNWGAGKPNKVSTMFPANIPADRLKTLIGLKYPAWVGGGLPDPAYPDETRSFILGGRALPFTKHGDTVYPD
jgi:hypothetical protein